MNFGAHELEGRELETDVAIIGGGASGLSLAAHLKRDLIVVDGGLLTPDPERDLEFRFETTGRAMNTQSLRRRLFGGAAALWSARCAELNAIDFVQRDWIDKNGWPIGFETLAPYFLDAWRCLGLPTPERLLPADKSKVTNQLTLPDSLMLQLWQFAFVKPEEAIHIGQHFSFIFHKPHRKLLNAADVISIQAENSKVTALQVVDRNGRIMTIKANHFVLACGCIEASRLLLDNREECPDLIGPIEKWLGRGFHQHLLLDGGKITAKKHAALRLQKTLNRFRQPPALSHEIGLRLSDKSLIEQRLANTSATFRYGRSARLGLFEKGRLVVSKIKGKEPVFNHPEIHVELSVEQKIDQNNMVSLSERRDLHGRRKASVHWDLDQIELQSAAAMNRTLSQWLQDTKIGTIENLDTPSQMSNRPMRESLHHMGGTRMSETAHTGVVDRNLTVHGTDNLSVVGGSVFPTGGQVNPTLTMIALSIRLAEHLEGKSA